MAALCFSMTFAACDGDDPTDQGDGMAGAETITPPDSLTRCEPGDVRHCGSSSCAGRVTCGDDGYWPSDEACTYPEEICDGADQDCDGEVDETFTDLGEGCQYNRDECSGPGVIVCAESGEETTCRPTRALRDLAETCDGRDEDCDGFVDETFSVGELCSNGVGACSRDGAFSCNDSGDGVVCGATPGEPSDESCDSRDNDCDGVTDEGFQVGEVCDTVGLGLCERSSVYECTSSGRGVTCPSVEAGSPSEELCDSVDNDCDGSTDESFGEGPATRMTQVEYVFEGSKVHSYSYDESGWLSLSSWTDVATGATQSLGYEYDEAGAILRVSVESSNAELNGLILDYVYNEAGQLSEVMIEGDEAGRSARYTYDEEGLLTELTYVETIPEELTLGFQLNSYNGEGELIERVSSGVVSPLEPAPMVEDRCETFSYDAGALSAWTVDYDCDESVDVSASYSYELSEGGEVLAETMNRDDGVVTITEYRYNEEGQRVEAQVNGGELGLLSSRVDARYSEAGELLYEELDLDGDGALDSSYTFTYSEGLLTLVNYDVDGDGAADLDLHLIYDEAGQHVATEATEAGTTEPVTARWDYVYDEEGRVSSESYDSDLDGDYERVERYSYDEEGRLATREVEEGEALYTFSYGYEEGASLASGADITGDNPATEVSYSYEEERLESATYRAESALLSRELHSQGCWID